MPKRSSRHTRVLVGLVLLLPLCVTASASAAVSLAFTGIGGGAASTTIGPGGTFGLSVYLNESATTDRVSGLDYRVQVSANGVAPNGIGYFKLVSRTSTSAFVPEAMDSSASVAPVNLSPTNGSADLGADRNGAADLTGVANTDVADYTLTLSNGTPVGNYTISFLGVGAFVLPTYSGSSANMYPTMQFTSENTFLVTVAAPEPSSYVTAFAAVGGLLMLVRAPRRRAIPAAATVGTVDRD